MSTLRYRNFIIQWCRTSSTFSLNKSLTNKQRYQMSCCWYDIRCTKDQLSKMCKQRVLKIMGRAEKWNGSLPCGCRVCRSWGACSCGRRGAAGSARAEDGGNSHLKRREGSLERANNRNPKFKQKVCNPTSGQFCGRLIRKPPNRTPILNVCGSNSEISFFIILISIYPLWKGENSPSRFAFLPFRNGI